MRKEWVVANHNPYVGSRRSRFSTRLLSSSRLASRSNFSQRLFLSSRSRSALSKASSCVFRAWQVTHMAVALEVHPLPRPERVVWSPGGCSPGSRGTHYTSNAEMLLFLLHGLGEGPSHASPYPHGPMSIHVLSSRFET